MAQSVSLTFQLGIASNSASSCSIEQPECTKPCPPISSLRPRPAFLKTPKKTAVFGCTTQLRSKQVNRISRSRTIAAVAQPSGEAYDEKRDEVLEVEADQLLPPLESENQAKIISPTAFDTPLQGMITSTGLRRTPLSGGVQSATTAHDLPPPAVAVRNLVEQARYAHLCTTMARLHHRRAGYPFGSLVDFAVDSKGHAVFSLSPLAIHTRNIRNDPRCSMVVQMPGWSGLANARVTIFGDLVPVPEDKIHIAQELFKYKHPQRQLSNNFAYYYMRNICDIYFVGGFGTVQWIDVEEYHSMEPDPINQSTITHSPEQTLHELNKRFANRLCQLMSSEEVEIEEANLVSIDKRGVDVRISTRDTQNVIRLKFQNQVSSLAQAHKEMETITGIADALRRNSL